MAGATIQGAMQGAHQEYLLIHTHSYTAGTACGRHLGLSVLPRETQTSTSGAGDRLKNGPLYH